MANSKYPNKLDTSVEIPKVRDNVTEIGSDVLNSLRSAIFNIERTLGINPHGVAGQTLASRLSNLIDENGNIKKEALDKAGLLGGPISNKDVAKTAGIDEFKLNLNFPTQLLQDEISIANTKIEQFTKALEELNRVISIHINLAATNRHNATAITVEAADSNPSDTALVALETSNLQSFIESVFNSHINYSGVSISAGNNSHSANQIFFDNSENSDLIFSDDVQGAIDDLASLEGSGLRSSILNLNSNGRIRTGSTVNSYEGSGIGKELVASSPVVYSDYSGQSRSTISFSGNPTVFGEISKFDILKISNSPNDEDNKDYLISSSLLNSDGTLSSVEIFDGPKFEFTEGTTASIIKSSFSNYNQNGLNSSVRPRALYTNNPVIQVALPNSATIISSGARFEKLEAGLYEYIAIEVDEESIYQLPVFNSSYSRQTIDTAIATINRFCVLNNLNLFAYKLRVLNCYEIAISHNIPDLSSDIKLRSIKLIEADEFDAAKQIGLEYVKNKIQVGSYGNNVHINGILSSEFGLPKVYNGDVISLVSSLTEISSSSINFLEEGVRVGDLCVIDGSSESSDNGTYLVKSVSQNLIQLDYTGNTFSGGLDENSIVIFLRSCAPITELDFIEPSSSIIIDIFADSELNIHYHKRADISGEIYLSNFYAVITDISKGFIGDGEEYLLTVNNDGSAFLTNSVTLDIGPEEFVGTTGDHKVFSKNGMEFITLKVFVPDESSPIFSSGTSSLSILGSTELQSSAYKISRCTFSPEFGIVIDDISAGLGEIGAPSVIDKRVSGTADDTIISEPFIERYIWGPRNELRSNGAIRGGAVVNLVNDGPASSCTVDIDPGVLVINGSRFEYLGDLDLPYDYSGGSTNNFYIGMNNKGCIVIGNEVDKSGGTNYVSPFSYETVFHLAYVNINEEQIIDLRFFVDRIDCKLSKEIIVSNDQNFGHFVSINDAIEYCRLYSKIYKGAEPPSILIREGVHEVTSSIYIDFDISIRGSGSSTIITRATSFGLSETNIATNSDDAVFIIGKRELPETDLAYGVTISDFTYRGIEGQDSERGGVVFNIRHEIANQSTLATFRISNINFIAASDYNVPSGAVDLSGGLGPNELPIRIGSGSGGDYQNILIDSCYFYKMGYSFGHLYLSGFSNSYQNIGVSNCISQQTLDHLAGYSIIRNPTGSSNSINNVQETSSMIS